MFTFGRYRCVFWEAPTLIKTPSSTLLKASAQINLCTRDYNISAHKQLLIGQVTRLHPRATSDLNRTGDRQQPCVILSPVSPPVLPRHPICHPCVIPVTPCHPMSSLSLCVPPLCHPVSSLSPPMSPRVSPHVTCVSPTVLAPVIPVTPCATHV